MKVRMNIRKLDLSEVLTFTVKISRELKIRMKVAVLLIKLAALILGCGVEIKNK